MAYRVWTISAGVIAALLAVALLVGGTAQAQTAPQTPPNSNCWAKSNGIQYKNRKGEVVAQFVTIKQYCADGKRAYDYGTRIKTWVKPGPREGEGWVYVPTALQKTDRYLTYDGRANGAHESMRQGRFVYRVPGVPQSEVRVPDAYRVVGAPTANTKVLKPKVIQTGIYDDRCTHKLIPFP